MYRFGDGTAFPLEENFIDTLTHAVESCTQAFSILAELDARREKAVAAERDSQREVERLIELDRAVATALAPFLPAAGGGGGLAQATASKIIAATKQSVSAVRGQVESRARALLAEAAPSTVAERVQAALASFFERVELPGTKWTLAWDVRGSAPRAEATATAGKLGAAFSLDLGGQWAAPLRNDQLASDVIVHLVRKRTFGKAKPTPTDLSKMLLVGAEHHGREVVLWLRESTKTLAGVRFTIAEDGVTFGNVSATGELEAEVSALGDEDAPNLRRLAEAAVGQLAALRTRRTVRELRFGSDPLTTLANPKAFPLELLAQLTPLCRMLRDRSPVAGELVLKRDIGDGRREELFVPRAALAARFTSLPTDYRRPFEDMGLGNDGEASSGAPAAVPPLPPGVQKVMG